MKTGNQMKESHGRKNPRKGKVHLGVLLLLPAAVIGIPIVGDFIYIDKVNWSGTTHHTLNTTAQVGGWARGPSISYSYETLAKFDVSSISGTVSTATLRFNVTAGMTGGPQTVTAFEVNQGIWNFNTVTYDTFCPSGPYSCVSWNSPLGEVIVDATQPGWYVIENPTLISKVQQWVDNASSNNGIVLSGNFYSHVYAVNIDQMELVVNGNTVPPDGGGGQPPAAGVQPSPSDFGQFTLVGTDTLHFMERVSQLGGDLGSNNRIEIGSHSGQTGNIYSGSDVILRDRAIINGKIFAANEVMIDVPLYTTINGEVYEEQQVQRLSIPTHAVNAGTQDLAIPHFGIVTVDPGAYRDLYAFHSSRITLKTGTYHFRKFVLEPDLTIIYDVTDGPISVNVEQEIKFDVRETIEFVGETNPLAVHYYTNQTQPMVFLGHDSKHLGIFTAPHAEVWLGQRIKFVGSVYARKITVEPDVVACGPTRIISLHHSEGAYGPFFNPNETRYQTIVPSTTTQLELGAVLERIDDVITVNGNPGTTIPIGDVPVAVTLTVSRPAIEGFPTECFESSYHLSIQRDANYSVRVNDNAPCTAPDCDGTTWDKAFHSLEDALKKAQDEGKEVWVAEGKYVPSKTVNPSDPRTATFLFKPGAELHGAFEGNETAPKPIGDIRETVISGDLNGDDASITAWPPSAAGDLALLSDNVYHAVTIAGGRGAIGVSIRNFSIKNGAATSSGLDAFGGGILNFQSAPEISRCIMERNVATVGGGGSFNGYAPAMFTDNLIKGNVAFDGRGGGIYNTNVTPMVINRLVMQNNVSLSNTSASGGGGMFCVGSSVELYNSVFVGNASEGDGGAILNDGGSLQVIQTTFTQNSGSTNGGITNVNADASVTNSLLWQNVGGELKGTNFLVDHTLVTGGYAGTGNIDVDPLFEDPTKPEGDDNSFFSIDDGLQLQATSPAVDAGLVHASEHAQDDILQTERPIDGDDQNGEEPDLGAYEYLNIKAIEAHLVGHYHEITGVFKPKAILTIIDDVEDPSEFAWLAKSAAAYTIQTTIKKNKHIKDSFYGNLTSVNNGAAVGPGFRVNFFKVGESGNSVTYSTQRVKGSGTIDGKPLVLVDDAQFENGSDSRAYVLRSLPGSELRFVVPHKQFK